MRVASPHLYRRGKRGPFYLRRHALDNVRLVGVSIHLDVVVPACGRAPRCLPSANAYSHYRSR